LKVRRGRTSKQQIDNCIKRRVNWKLKREALDRSLWITPLKGVIDHSENRLRNE